MVRRVDEVGVTTGQTSARLMVLELEGSTDNGPESLFMPKEYLGTLPTPSFGLLDELAFGKSSLNTPLTSTVSSSFFEPESVEMEQTRKCYLQDLHNHAQYK